MESLADALVELLHGTLGFCYVELWLRDADGVLREMRRSGRREKGARRRRYPLAGTGAEMGHLILATVARPRGDRALLGGILTLVAAAITTTATGSPIRADQLQRIQWAQQTWSLSPRQLSVLALVVQGLSNKEIAVQLDCADNTVELHMTQILRRSESSGRCALIARFWSESGPLNRPHG